MGCDIHCFAEKLNKEINKWEMVEEDVFSLDEWTREYYKKEKTNRPFNWRSYSMFAFLADVRNYDCCTPLSEPKGLPDDVSENIKQESDDFGWDGHSHSYLSLKELLDFNYEQKFWNRRVTKQTSVNSWDGASLAEEGEGEIISYKENLGKMFFTHLEELKQLGNPEEVRIVFLV